MDRRKFLIASATLGPLATALPVSAKANYMTTYDKIHDLMQEITDLLTGDAPEGCDVNGVCWNIVDGKTRSIWASGRQGPHLVNYRESVGWSVDKVTFA